MELNKILSSKINLILVKKCALSNYQMEFYFKKYRDEITEKLLELQGSTLHWVYFKLPNNQGRLRFFKQKNTVDISLESPLIQTAKASFHRLVYELHEYQKKESYINDLLDTH
jgi:hypothetical protein